MPIIKSVGVLHFVPELKRQRRINVQHEWIDVGTKLGNNERYAVYFFDF